MSIKNSPCLNCEHRTLTCHGVDEAGEYVCSKYAEYRADIDATNAARSKEKYDNWNYVHMRRESIKKTIGRKRTK